MAKRECWGVTRRYIERQIIQGQETFSLSQGGIGSVGSMKAIVFVSFSRLFRFVLFLFHVSHKVAQTLPRLILPKVQPLLRPIVPFGSIPIGTIMITQRLVPNDDDPVGRAGETHNE
jgi:hypothetical protein